MQLQQFTSEKKIIVNESLLEGLQSHYGKIEGEDVYLNMRKDNKGVYRKGLRTAREHGHVGEYTPKYVNWKKRK